MEGEARHYEFDAAQNELIGLLAKRMTWVGRFMIVFSIFAVIGGIAKIREDGLGVIIQAGLILVLALWTLRAASSFNGIVTTAGSDISNLMAALGELKKLYTLQYWVVVVAIVLVGVALIVALGAGLT
jgi:hypothetical protein